ncbi:MAG: dephospho-CoA kinase [Endomicrobium sp.]|uniref:dephospho-CoA kinase n=1 Tax=Candidatus Endomicrobiellum pyrsonymphae TaxID=1408203 RepID=UPI0035871709|nr:dephospho-CoA kinase [Endomicrobium sp.]
MIIGLTGGIATGKSESAKYFEELGAYSIDADAISRDITKQGMPALAKLVKIFGNDILYCDGNLNRQKLANIVFSDKQSKLEVDKVLHVYIIARINEIISRKTNKPNVIVNAPLLFEVGLDRICDKIVVIWIPYDIEVKRLALRDNLNTDEVKKRIDSQMPLEKKTKLADFVIDNSGSKKELKEKIINLYKLLTSGVE